MSGRVLVVDDIPANIALLEAVLIPAGYEVVSATTGEDGLELARSSDPDLVLLDIDLPGIDGLEVCRTLRADAATAMLPIVMITATSDHKKVKILEIGADDFVPKPFRRDELLARVKSLIRIKRYQDEIQAMNEGLRDLVAEQVDEIGRLGRLRRFLSPSVADLVVSEGDNSLLDVHQREITVLFSDIRNFTAFTRSVELEQVTEALDTLHEATGELVRRFDATVGNFTGDGLMVFFNDPVPRVDAAGVAVEMAREARALIQTNLIGPWQALGHDIGFGQGIATGTAMIGQMGFEGRHDYTVIGTVANLASRLSDHAEHGEILICDDTRAGIGTSVPTRPAAPLTLKGFDEAVTAWHVD